MSKTIEIKDFEVQVNELTVRDVMESISDLAGFMDENVQPKDMFNAKNMDALLKVAERIVKFPKGKSMLDLAFSDIQKLMVPVMEVNQAFFGQMAALGLLPTSYTDEELTQPLETGSQAS